jgi:glyoxylase-like metal-dependent hydrolase (beta-lactamase superfamily II)
MLSVFVLLVGDVACSGPSSESPQTTPDLGFVPAPAGPSDGVGANVDPATGAPAFPRARYLVPGAEMTALTDGHREGCEGCEGLLDVEHAGLLDRYDDRVEPAPGIVVDPLPGHNPGHYGVYVGDPPGAVVVGHLFLHPAQIANPDVTQGDHDPGALQATRRTLLERCERDGLLVIAPLFAGGHSM